MATSLQTIRRLTIESRTVGVDETSQKLARLGQAQDGVAASSERASRQAGAYEQALASQQRSIDLANQAYLQMARDRAALASSMQQQVAANDNVARSFTVAGLEAAEMANHLRTAATAAYAFSPAFREVVNGMAAPALRGAGVALVAVAGGLVTATNLAGSGLVRLGASSALASSSLTPVAGAITSAGLAMQAFNPSLTGVASTILGRLLPALRLLGAVGVVVNAAGLLADAWRLGGEELERYRGIAESAAKVDLSTTYFQKLIKGAENAKVPVDALTAALTNLQKSSADQLGGSALESRLAASVKAGNFGGNSGVQDLAQANTTQQRFEAIVSLINQAMTAGQRLAALDIAGTAFGPEVVENLRKDSEYLDKIKAAADKVAEKTLVSPEDIGRAVELQSRYDAAVKLLETRWHPVQDLLTQAGVEFHANWVATVETIAQGFDWAAKLVAKLGDVPSWFAKKINEGSQWIIDATTTPESRKAAEVSGGITSDPVEMAKGTDAYSIAVNKLRAGLQDQAEMQRKVSEANTIAQKTLGDTSKAIGGQKKEVAASADAYDRALEGVAKHTARLEADTKAVGLGAGALDEYRARTQLMTAAQLAGREMTAELTAQIEKQAKAAGVAGQALAQARLNSTIKFEGDTTFLSDADKKIASILRQVYGDDKWKSMMDGPIAGALRFNDAIGDLSDGLRDIGQSGFSAFLSGKNAMDAMVKSADALAKKLADKAFDNILSGNPMQMGIGLVQAGASALISAFTGDQKAREELRKAKEEWAQAAPAFEAFLKTLSGGVNGSLATMFTQLADQTLQFLQQATRAQDYAAVARTSAAFNASVYRATDSFKESFGGMLEAIESGLGPNSPFSAAAENAKAMGKALQAFIDDARVAYSNDRVAAATNSPGLVPGGGEAQMAAATAAAARFVVSLLGQAPVLSETATAIQRVNGTAAALRSVLFDLGTASGDAANAINAGVIAAMAELAAKFTDGLQREINDALGQGYLNSTADLIAKRTAALSDAAALGAGSDLVDRWFSVQAQKLVDDAKLTGDAFANLLQVFPDLRGAVHAFAEQATIDTAAATAAAQAAQQARLSQAQAQLSAAQSEYASAQSALSSAYEAQKNILEGLISAGKGFVDQFAKLKASLRLNDTLSPLSAQDKYLEAQAQARATAALAAGGDATAQARLADDLNAYLAQSKSYNASTLAYYNDFTEVQSILDQAGATAQQQVDVAQQQLAVLNQQVAGLISINGSVMSVAAAVANLQTAMSNLNAAQGNLNNQRDWGLRPEVNKLLDQGMKAAGINYTGNFGPSSGFQEWVNSQTQSTQDQIYAVARSIPQSLLDYYARQGLQNGGIVGAFANGGMIGNGTYGVDSLIARYAGGGNIALAGGEYVMPADQTRANLPQLEAMRSGRGGGNDNTETNAILRDIARRLDRVEAATLGGSANVREGVDRLGSAQKQSANETRQAGNRPAAYGTRKAS